MRNGNKSQDRKRSPTWRLFNRIYEEWKPMNLYIHSPSQSGSIESMRNGNEPGSALFLLLSWVQSNLWGMETADRWFFRFGENRVQSNLWGMETWIPFVLYASMSWFNRIYEEWKHRPHSIELFLMNCSIESMRNGNSIWPLFKLAGLVGSIESMRNGNHCCRHPQSRWNQVQSNLWGMETRDRKRVEPQRGFVQSNLWGMETTPSREILTIEPRFNRIYEEWKLTVDDFVFWEVECSIESMRNGNRFFTTKHGAP